MPNGWIGVDLDATLATYDVWRGIDHIGKPIPVMVDRIHKWIADGHTVKIFTARVAHGTRNITEATLARLYIQQWLTDVAGLPALDITNIKDPGMFMLIDDRCTQVVPNTGERYVVVLPSEYKEMQRDQNVLEALRRAGVDNWDGWDIAMRDINGDDEDDE